MAKVNISLKDLLDAGAHFGHQSKRWNPKMSEFLYGTQDGVHVFDLPKTKEALEAALDFLATSKKEGKVILFVGTKKQAKEKLKEVAVAVNSPYIDERWLGGTLTNFDQIKRSLKKLADLKTGMTDGTFKSHTKKERLLIEREIERLERFFGGLVSLEKKPDVLFVVDTHKETTAIREAKRLKIPVVGIVDSNADPEDVDYPIPMNDDAAAALTYVLDVVKKSLSK